MTPAPPAGRSPLTAQAPWLAAVLLVVTAAYALVPLGGFVWDDHFLITPKAISAYPSTLSHFTRFLWTGMRPTEAQFFRPLITLGFSVESALWGARPAPFHLANLLLHLACVALVWRLCRCRGVGIATASTMAMLFGTFPRLSESVAWISGRSDLAATTFVLGALVLHRPGPGAWLRKAAAAISLLAGLLCKEIAVAALVALILDEWHRASDQPRRFRAVLVRLTPAVLATAAYAVLRAQAARHVSAGLFGIAAVKAPSVTLTLEAIGTNLLMLLDPLRPRLQIGLAGVRDWPLVGMGGVTLCLAMWTLARSWHLLDTGARRALALTATSLALVLHIFPLGIESVAADRYLYLPLAGVVLALARPAEKTAARYPRLFRIGAATVIVTFAAATFLRTQDWIDELRLWRTAVRHAPAPSVLARVGLADVLLARGQPRQALTTLEPLTAHSTAFHSLAPQTALALALDGTGQYNESVSILENVLQAAPTFLRAHAGLVLALAHAERFADARARAQLAQRNLAGHSHSSHRAYIDQLLTLVTVAESALAALPAEQQNEIADTRAARARIHARMKSTASASTRWLPLVIDETASPALRREGLLYLVLNGDTELAQQALAVARNTVLPQVDLTSLSTLLDARIGNDSR